MITNRAGDSFEGFIKGQVQGTDSDGFNIDISEAHETQYVTYQAYKFPENSEIDIGTFQNPTSTGTKEINTGFQPDFTLFSTTNTVSQMDYRRGVSSGTYGWSHGVAGSTSSGLEQRAFSLSVHSASTNGHASASNDSRVINQLFTDLDGNIQSRSLASLNSFDTDGFTLDYSSVPNTGVSSVESSQYPTLYVALKSPVRKQIGNFTTPSSTGTQQINTGFEPDSVSTVITNYIPSADSEQESGGNVVDGSWGWYFGTLEDNYQQSFGFSSHSNSMNGHASSATEQNLFRVLHTDKDGNIQDEDIGSGTISKNGFEVEWTALSDTSTNQVKFDQLTGFYWSFSNRLEPTGTHDTGWIQTDLNASWNTFDYEALIDSGSAQTDVYISKDGSNSYKNKSFNLFDGTNTEDIKLGSGNWIKFVTELQRDNELSPTIKNYTGNYKAYNTSLNPEDPYEAQHSFNNSVETEVNGGTKGDYTCTLYYNSGFGFREASSDGGISPIKSLSNNVLTCNSTVSKDLSLVDSSQINSPIEYFFEIEDAEGVIAESETSSRTLPNSIPSSEGFDTQQSSTAHEFDFTGYASDEDGEEDFTSCTVKATDGDVSSPVELGGLSDNNNGDNQVSCPATISDQTTSKFDVGETITVWSEFTDAGGEKVETSQTIVEIPNQDPTINEETNFNLIADTHSFDVLANASDVEGDSLSCEVTVSDRDGNQATLSGDATSDNGGVQCSKTISDNTLAGFEVGDIIDSSVQFSDNYGGSIDTNTNSKEIPNQAPDVPSSPSLDVGDKDHVIDHDPEADWTQSTDPEGDEINYTIYIKENGGTAQKETEVSSTSSEIGNSVSLQDGNSYEMLVEACDPFECSSRSSYSFTMNTPPQISGAGVNASSVAAGEAAEIEADITDPEGDSITSSDINFTVYAGQNQIINGTNTTTTEGGLEISQNFTVEDSSYNWTVSATDGFENNSVTGSFEPGNANPVIELFESDVANNAHSFNVSAKTTDSNDNDIDGYNITITDGTDTYQSQFTDPDTEEFNKVDNNTYYANFSNINQSLKSSFNIGDSLDVEIRLFDKNGSTDSSTLSETIPNKEPSISGSIDTSNAKTTDKIVSDYSYSDPESDAVDEEIYRWYKNGQPTSVTSANLSASRTSKGEKWSVRIQVRDEFGAYSTEDFSSNITIQNSAPQITSELNYKNLTGHRIEANYTGNDFNEDTQTCNFNQSGTTHPGNADTSFGNRTEFLCSITLTKEELSADPLDKISLEGNTSDSSAFDLTSQKEIQVPNIEPEIELDTPEISKKFTQDSVNLSWTGSDEDGDDLNYTVYVNDEKKDFRSKEFYENSYSDGNYSWKIEAIDYNSSKNLSKVNSTERYFLVDTTAPIEDSTTTNVVNSTRNKPLQNQSVEIITEWSDAAFKVDNITIYDEATDESKTFDGNSTKATIKAEDLQPGNNSYEITARDIHGNTKTITGKIDAEDIYKPNATLEYFTPNNPAQIDPGSEITFVTSAEDNLEISETKIRFRDPDENWQTGSTSAEYNFSFTPQKEGTYNYSLQFIDPDNNTKKVNGSIDVFYDYNWRTDRTEFEEITTTLNENNAQYEELKIINPGDSKIDLSIGNETDEKLELNLSESNLEIPAGENKTIQINASLNKSGDDTEDEGSYEFELNLNTTSDNRTNTTVQGSALFTLDAPYLNIQRGEIPLSVDKGDSIELEPILENQGPETGNEIWWNIEAPEGWNIEEPNITIGNLSSEIEFKERFQADITDEAEIGTQTLTFNSKASNRDRTFTSSFELDVIDPSSNTTIVEESGGGPVQQPETGPTRQQEVTEASDQIFNSTESFELVRGQDQNFTVGFTNPTKYNLSNISIEASGFRAQYLDLKTEYIESLNVNESKNISVAITAPDFFASSSFNIDFYIDGVGYDSEAFVNPYFNFTLNKGVNLEIHEISRERAQNLTGEMERLKEELNRSGLSDNEVEEIFSDAEQDIEDGNYGSVQERFQQAQNVYDTATETKEGLEKLDTQIKSAQTQGLTVSQSRRMSNLAEAALERGAYQTASNRLDEAQNLYQLETKGQVNYIYLLRSNWEQIVIAIIIVSIVTIVGYYRYKLYRINSRLKEIDQEEQNIAEMKLGDQKQAFEEAEMSIDEYEDAVEDYNQDLIDLIKERADLESRKANLMNLRKEKSLRQKQDKLKEVIQHTQEDYVKGNIADTEMYETKVEELTEQLSTIESDLAEIQAKSEQKNSWIPFR